MPYLNRNKHVMASVLNARQSQTAKLANKGSCCITIVIHLTNNNVHKNCVKRKDHIQKTYANRKETHEKSDCASGTLDTNCATHSLRTMQEQSSVINNRKGAKKEQ